MLTMKRTFDFSVALAALILLLPILAAVAFAIWAADRRNPFYAGSRIARGGGYFRMLKFRTMRPDAWKTGVNSTASGDARITPIGKLLRPAKLDELPQLWNVLVGDMSLVGPRPQVPADAALYTAEERRMLSVRPGITDLASIVFADEGDILADSADPDLLYNQIIRPWKSRLALLYVDRRSFAMDLRILFLTATAFVSRRRAIEGVGPIVREPVERFFADPFLFRMASRREPLLAYPPPGAHHIVQKYAQEQPCSRAANA
jgi:lipopolysaccharide/colanic/teichoic acid biosynthesis glycosyltransferase